MDIRRVRNLMETISNDPIKRARHLDEFCYIVLLGWATKYSKSLRDISQSIERNKIAICPKI